METKETIEVGKEDRSLERGSIQRCLLFCFPRQQETQAALCTGVHKYMYICVCVSVIQVPLAGHKNSEKHTQMWA